MAKNILTDRLSKLVENGVFGKQRPDEPGPRFEYKLSSKGRDLWIGLTAMRLCRDVAGLIAVDAYGVPVEARNSSGLRGPVDSRH